MSLSNFLLIVTLSVVTYSDIRKNRISNICVFISAACQTVCSLFVIRDYDYFVNNVLAAFFTMLILCTITITANTLKGHSLLGGGDIKLYSLIAYYIGFWNSMYVIFLSCLIGMIFYMLSIITIAIRERKSFPLAPFISIATLIVMIYI